LRVTGFVYTGHFSSTGQHIQRPLHHRGDWEGHCF